MKFNVSDQVSILGYSADAYTVLARSIYNNTEYYWVQRTNGSHTPGHLDTADELSLYVEPPIQVGDVVVDKSSKDNSSWRWEILHIIDGYGWARRVGNSEPGFILNLKLVKRSK